MCGIFGIYSFSGGPPHRDRWPSLVNQLIHRGPDEGGWWSDGPFFLGHRRLSIIGLETGKQPMATSDGEYVVTYNGEIYNFPDLRKELTSLGHHFQTDSDTETILHGYREWGEALPSRLTGMFAFAIADRKRNELFVARDRFGEKPFFYAHTDRYFAFASELKGLAALPDLPRELDHVALSEYLCLNYVPGDRTLLRAVRRLPPATWMKLKGKEERHRVYWKPPRHDNTSTPIKLQEALDQWMPLFDQAVKRTLLSDVPVGIFLSGGLDSALIAESAARQGQLNKAYFLDFENPSYSERKTATYVAKHLGLPLEDTTLRAPDLDNFLDLVEHADDPLADSSALPVWKISQLAAKENKVILGGDGGDEIFGGYLTYKASAFHDKIICSLPRFLRQGLKFFGGRIPTSEKKVTFSYKLWRFLRAADLPTGKAHFTWNGTWLPDEARTFFRDPAATLGPGLFLDDLVSRYDLKQQSGFTALQKADLSEYLPNDILTKVDRISMAHGLEVRAPFLDVDMAEWALATPMENAGSTKPLLRAAVSHRYGKWLASVPKKGFSIPIHQWIRGPLRERMQYLLEPTSVKRLGILDASRVTDVFQKHLTGKKSYGFELWGLAVLVAWHQCRIEKQPPPSPDASLTEYTFPLRDSSLSKTQIRNN